MIPAYRKDRRGRPILTLELLRGVREAARADDDADLAEACDLAARGDPTGAQRVYGYLAMLEEAQADIERAP